MSLIDDLRAVSENAVEQLAARFADPPRPLLAAIGAGDIAVAHIGELRGALADSLGVRISAPSVDRAQMQAAVNELPARAQKLATDMPATAQRIAADLPTRAQKVGADLSSGIEQFAAQVPAKAAQVNARLAERFAEAQVAARSLSPDALQETMDAYARLAGNIYGNLADRGSAAWTKMRSAGMRSEAVVDEGEQRPATAAAREAAAASARAAAAGARAAVVAAAAGRATPNEPAPAAQSPAAAASPDATGTISESAAEAAVGPPTTPRRKTSRTAARTVTTPDGKAKVTVAPRDVIPKGAHVRPRAPGRGANSPTSSTSGNSAPDDASDPPADD